jgi:hypothetical protein
MREFTTEELRLVSYALDLYIRVGIGHLEAIKDHPTFTKHLENEFKDEEGNTIYSQYHLVRDQVDSKLTEVKKLLYNDDNSFRGHWGIYHPNVDDSCREAYDLIKELKVLYGVFR